MSNEPEPPYRAPREFTRGMLVWPVAIVLTVLAAYLWQREPRQVAHAFVTAARRGDRAALIAMGTSEFRSNAAAGRLNADPHPDPRDNTDAALAALATSTDATFTNFSLGPGAACMSGSFDVPAGRGGDLYVDVRLEDGSWRVQAVSLVHEVGFCEDD